MDKFTNQLVNESSLYLQQHAHNPVNWYAWNEETLAKAREENKPILLSIGYSACHWCHVMAHESFEDEETAELMNKWFVNIKVDREERPDLDKIYQLLYQLFTRQPGGWPLTVFLTPDNHLPFFVGTYFPKHRGTFPSFKEVLVFVHDIFTSKKTEIVQQNHSIQEMLDYLKQQEAIVSTEIDSSPLQVAREQLLADFDSQNGGFGDAPKFPQPGYLEFLVDLLLNQLEKDESVLNVVTVTLQKMASRGLFDHLGGGFFRYCVDEQWHIPHFEKMLYDNAQLLWLYARMLQVSSNDLFQQTIDMTAQWVMTSMQGTNGGYFATLAADTEGKEGHFYVWDREEIKSLLTDDEYKVIELYFGLDKPPNFEGKWHLFIHKTNSEIAEFTHQSVSQVDSLIEVGKRKLFTHRNKRIKPERDEKIVISWNGLMIKAMALIGESGNNQDWLNSAEKALSLVRNEIFSTGKEIFLDDFAFLADAIIQLLQIRWRSEDLQLVQRLSDTMLELFEDKTSGGFYFTKNQKLIYRTKQYIDESVPSGNAIATQVMLRLGYLLGNTHYINAAERSLKNAFSHIQKSPEAHGHFLITLEEFIELPEIFIIRGSDQDIRHWHKLSQQYQQPHRLIFCIPTIAKNLPPAIEEKASSEKGVIAYHCLGTQCFDPITNEREFENVLKRFRVAS